MNDEIEAVESVQPGVSRWRRLSAAACVAAVVGVGSLLAAGPASAATPNDSGACYWYHSWYECLAYSGGDYYLSVTNDYGVKEYETSWFDVNGYTVDFTGWLYPGTTNFPGVSGLPAPGSASAGIDNVTIVPQI